MFFYSDDFIDIEFFSGYLCIFDMGQQHHRVHTTSLKDMLFYYEHAYDEFWKLLNDEKIEASNI